MAADAAGADLLLSVPELRELRYFVAVAEELNFTRAAQRLHLAQQSLSRAIIQLEARVGLQLLVRDRRRVQVTPAGRTLLAHARELLAGGDALMNALDPHRSGRAAALRVGVFAQGAAELTPFVLRAFAAAHPDVPIVVTALPWGHLEPLAAGHVDVAFVMPPYGDQRVHVTPLLYEPRVAAVSLTHPLANDPEVSITQILDARYPPRHAQETKTWGDHWQLVEERGEEPRRAQITPVADFISLLMQVANHDLVETIPASVSRLYPNPGVTFLPIVDLPPEQTQLALATRALSLSDSESHFLDVAAQVAGTLSSVVAGAQPPPAEPLDPPPALVASARSGPLAGAASGYA